MYSNSCPCGAIQNIKLISPYCSHSVYKEDVSPVHGERKESLQFERITSPTDLHTSLNVSYSRNNEQYRKYVFIINRNIKYINAMFAA